MLIFHVQGQRGSSLESLLVQPRSEDWQSGRILRLDPSPLQRAIIIPQRIRGQHDGQLELN